MKTETVKLSQVAVNDKNPRTITEQQFKKLVNSILIFPKMLELRPIVVDDMMKALGGNMRYRALSAIAEMSPEGINSRLSNLGGYRKRTQGEREVLKNFWTEWLQNPTATIIKASELSEEEQREFIIKDNVGYGDWDTDALAGEWDSEELNEWGLDLLHNDWDMDGEDGEDGGSASGTAADGGAQNGSLQDRFIVPPFSILDTRKGYWQTRKKMWRSLIGDMGESRKDTLITSPEIKYKDLYLKTRADREKLGISFREYLDKYVSDEVKEHEANKVLSQGVSLLDPVLSEIVCKWFGLEHCKTFDCFAGDTVFGFVSAKVGNEFTGIELRQEQADYNNSRVEGMSARYICDDGQNVAQHIKPQSQDLLFSCPPYFDLEVYSDLPNDASNQGSYEDFIKILRNAFTAAVGCLKNNRFAVITIGDMRNKRTGFYYDFRGDIIKIFEAAGMYLYNEIILVETGASTALRASRYMDRRKVGKMHQNVLVFYKGDTNKIKDTFPKIEYSPEDEQLFEQETGADTSSTAADDNDKQED